MTKAYIDKQSPRILNEKIAHVYNIVIKTRDKDISKFVIRHRIA